MIYLIERLLEIFVFYMILYFRGWLTLEFSHPFLSTLLESAEITEEREGGSPAVVAWRTRSGERRMRQATGGAACGHIGVGNRSGRGVAR